MNPHILVNYLNHLNDVDPVALHQLINNRVPCNKGLQDHPTVQVSVDGVGLLGILNGLIGYCGNYDQLIVMEVNDDGSINRFSLNTSAHLKSIMNLNVE